jgi:predicted transcriptional regulator
MVVDRRTVESISDSEWFGEELNKDLCTGNFDLWVHEQPVPYQIGVMDGRLCLGAENDDRMPVAMLETENKEAIEWAERVHSKYKDRSKKLEPGNFD